MSLNIASGLALHGNESYPGVLNRSADLATIMLLKMVRENAGWPGIGFEAKANLYQLLSGIGK